MNTEWICSWQYIPSCEKHTESFPTLDAARKAMAKVLAEAVDLSSYIQALRKEDGEDCDSSADFLEKFLSNLTMPESEKDLPDCYDIPEHCLFEFDSCDGFRWGYMRGECPYLSAGHVYEGKEIEPYVISFNYENSRSVSRDRVNAVEIRITEHINYGTSAYPLMVLFALREYPQLQEQIIRTIAEIWDTIIDRKAVGRHLQLLQDLGFPVQHGSDGYYYNGKPSTPKTNMKYSPSAYPLLILQELDHTSKTKTAIIRSVQEKYGAKIDRKAVSRHLELLEALGVCVEKCEDGYYIGK